MIVYEVSVDLSPYWVLSPLTVIGSELVLPSAEGDLRLEERSLVDWNARDVDERGVDDGCEGDHKDKGFHFLEIEIIISNRT